MIFVVASCGFPPVVDKIPQNSFINELVLQDENLSVSWVKSRQLVSVCWESLGVWHNCHHAPGLELSAQRAITLDNKVWWIQSCGLGRTWTLKRWGQAGLCSYLLLCMGGLHLQVWLRHQCINAWWATVSWKPSLGKFQRYYRNLASLSCRPGCWNSLR